MKLTLKQAYRSIDTCILPDSLPKFVVITGLNGSGKTHLLEAIDKGYVVAKKHNDQPINRIKFFDYKMLQPKDVSIPPNQLTTERNLFWTIIHTQALQQRKQAQQQLSTEPEQPLDDAALKAIYEELSTHQANAEVSELDVKYHKAMDVRQQVLVNVKAQCAKKLKESGGQEAQVNKAIEERGSNSDDILDSLQQKTSLPLFLLDKSTFDRLYDPIIAYDPFNRSYSMWFSRYMEEYYINQTRAINRDRIGHDHITYKKDDEFKKLYGEFPWISINRFFAKVGLPFTINAPEAGSQQQFKATITDNTGNVIQFDSFSSGEEIILSLVSALSYANENDKLSTLPDLLLLDEIDAPLHPSMTDFLLATLNESIVEDQGISVILTTHSPSTVAMAPEESLYELKKDSTKKTLEKISKDAAISLLTAGVPTLSVSYDNRRIVLVESKYDAKYYTLIDGLIRHQKRTNNQEIQSELSLGSVDIWRPS